MIASSPGRVDQRAQRARWNALPAVAVLLAAWAIGWEVYAVDELGLDGHLSVGLALLPPDRLLDFLTRDVHPPLYYLALKGWLGATGMSFVAARWPSVAAATATLALLYRLARQVAGRRGAVAALVLAALSPAFVAVSATARDFAPGLCFSVASVVLWHEIDCPHASERRRWLLVGLGLTTALALATWYFHALFLAIQGIDLLVRRSFWLGRAAALLGGAVAQVPWLVVAAPPLVGKVLGGVTVSGERPALPDAAVVASAIGREVAGALPAPLPAGVAVVASIAIVAMGAWTGWRSGDGQRRWTLLALGGIAIGLVAIAGLTWRWSEPKLLGRYAIVLLPWAAVLQARAFSVGKLAVRNATDSWRTFSLLLGACVVCGQVGAGLALATAPRIDWDAHSAVTIAEREAAPGDVVIVGDHARAGLIALRGRAVAPVATVHLAGSAFLRDDVPRETARLDPLLAARDAVWLVQDRGSGEDGMPELIAWLTRDRFPTVYEQRGTAMVARFARPSALVDQPGGTFGDIAELLEVRRSPSSHPGDLVYVELRWRGVRLHDVPYKVFAHLVTAEGERVAQHDGMPVLWTRLTNTWTAGEVVPDRFTLLVPPNAPPGEYWLLVGLYHESTRLRLPDGSDYLRIGPIVVE